jgi:GTP-binding protein EngB required for normal cell division
VTEYFVKNKSNNSVYRLIDTPGFGDTEGYERDEKTLDFIRSKLSSLKQIHMIIFVMKSTMTRLNIHQKYVMQSLMNLFTKDYIKNIMFLLTFADTGKSVIHSIISDKTEGYGNYSDQF